MGADALGRQDISTHGIDYTGKMRTFSEEGFQLAGPFQCREMIEN